MYKHGSNLEKGCLLQLRNLINRRNVAADITGRFNATVDFFELAVECHITAAAMNYFGMESPGGVPMKNKVPSNIPTKDRSKVFKRVVSNIVDRYVIIHEVSEHHPLQLSTASNPHQARIQTEHSYASPCEAHVNRIIAEHSYVNDGPPSTKKRRVLPRSMVNDQPSILSRETAPDGIFEYACAVLNDGLIFLEFRDAIHEGDGERIIRCWKVMLLYFFHGKRTKYTLEAIHLQAAINACVSPCLREELMWCRVLNTRGGLGNNLPTDLFMEHLNRTLKEYLRGLGPNSSEKSMMQMSKSLRGLMDFTKHFDDISQISPDSISHTKYCNEKDKQMILKELTTESKVFDYIPGRLHKSFKSIKAHISKHLDTHDLINTIKRHQQSIADHMDLKSVLSQERTQN